MYSIDLIVEISSSQGLLDSRMQTFGALTGRDPTKDGYWPVRVIAEDEQKAKARAGFIEFVLHHQGYGKVHRWQDIDGKEVEER